MKSARGSPTLGFVIALGAAALLIVLATLLPEPKEEVPGAIGAVIDTPLPGGTVMPLQDAVRAADSPLYRASVPLASDDAISEVWVRTKWSPEVLIIYETGVVTIIEPESMAITLQGYAERQSQDGVPGAIQQVGGLDAFVVDPGFGERGTSVMFIIDGTIVTLVAHDPSLGISADDLIGVALSVVDRSSQMVAEKQAL